MPIWGLVLRVGGWGSRRFSSFRLRGGGSNIALGLRKRILFNTKEGESRLGRGLGVGGWARRRFSKLLATHFLLLHNPCRLEGPQHFKAGDKISNGPQVVKMATSPLPLGVPDTSKRGTMLAVAHKWVKWLHHPYHLGGPQHFKAGDNGNSDPQVGKMATSPLPFGGSPTL